jgi:DNA replication protein DnaC
VNGQLLARLLAEGAAPLAEEPEGRVFGDEVLASAILDRLLHHAEVISINGPSYRLKDHMLEQREGGDARRQS